MTNPSIITIPAATWYKAVSSIERGILRVLDHSYEYLYTTRDAGDATPIAAGEGAIFKGTEMLINSDIEIDVYIYAPQGGKMRLDV